MNLSRRSFLGGVSAAAASAALPPMPALAAPYGRSPALAALEGIEHLTAAYMRGLSQKLACTIIYGTDEAPTEFTGFAALVPVEDNAEIRLVDHVG
jgi:hypothetical protein